MNAIVFDTETTGLLLPSLVPLGAQPRIIELGALRVSATGAVTELSQLLNPEQPLSPTITRITRLRDEDLVERPTFAEYLPQLKEFFVGADVLLCHNAPFDTGMLRNELARAQCEDFPWPAQTLCTVQEYAPLFGRRLKLSELYAHIVGVPLAQTHRALDDARAVYAVLMRDRFFEQLGWSAAT